MRAGAGGGVGAELIGPMGAAPMPPCFCIFFSSLSCRANSLLLSLISFFARTILHFSQVISTISCMGAPLTNFPMLSGFVRLIPQPVFFPFSVPWTTPPLIALMRKICMVILLSMVLHFKLYSILNKKASPPTEKIEKSIQKMKAFCRMSGAEYSKGGIPCCRTEIPPAIWLRATPYKDRVALP